MKQNYKLTIAYDGSRYYGWEHQPDKPTVQGKLEDVLTRAAGRPLPHQRRHDAQILPQPPHG